MKARESLLLRASISPSGSFDILSVPSIRTYANVPVSIQARVKELLQKPVASFTAASSMVDLTTLEPN